jgi:L-glutamine-phosphate cytidylyltransferase
MYAVVLAAGLGKRLGGDGPKPLTQIAPGLTLLSNQLAVLSSLVGMDRIVLVLGHQAQRVIEAHPGLMYVYNKDYAATNTAKSLLCALRKFDDDVLWTNGDVYFEAPAVRRLVGQGGGGVRLLVNRADTGDEEVKYRLGPDGSVAELSKGVRGAAGESVGVQVVSRDALPALVAALDGAGAQDYFEKAIERCIQDGAFRVTPVDVGDAYVREVDFPADLEAVRTHLSTHGGGERR